MPFSVGSEPPTLKMGDGNKTSILGSRSYGVEYQNTTGNILVVSVRGNNEISLGRGDSFANDPTISASGSTYNAVTLLIPPDWYYICEYSGSSLDDWFEMELRI